MATVKILLEGYVSTESNGRSCSTITLVQDNNINMVVDPGTLADPELLINALKENNLTINDINIVCITHSHMDHYRNIGLFNKAKALDFWGWWENDTWTEYKEVSKDIQILNTPGHSKDSITLLVKTDKGTIAICGDVFWKKDYPKHDKYAEDEQQLNKSRKLVLEKADFIIPGHGKMYSPGEESTLKPYPL